MNEEVPNGDEVDFRKLYFSQKKDCGTAFYRCYAERCWFHPLGERLSYHEDVAVPVRVMGAEPPDGHELNRLIAERMKLFPEMFECALGKYVEVIGVDDFSERLIDDEFSADMVCPGGNEKMSREDLLKVWKGGECHRISELSEVTYNPVTGHLGLFFRMDWEGYFEGYGFGLLISGDRIDYGIDQSYWGFCEDDAAGWFDPGKEEALSGAVKGPKIRTNEA